MTPQEANPDPSPPTETGTLPPPEPQTTGTTTTATTVTTTTIIVASKNPVKIAASQQAFTLMFPHTRVTAHGISVPSGVPDQPFSDATTLRGAQNRAELVRELHGSTELKADYWVGIEGGVDEDPYFTESFDSNTALSSEEGPLLRSFAWAVVLGPVGGKMGKARTATYYLPRETAALVRGGMELGDADAVVFGGRNTKQKNGSVGLLTGDVVDRRGYYEQAVVLALIPFCNPGLSF
ncbi:inosine triphosphate pyrophosphatase-like protein [Chaetomidium leptoderma]|uniref:inosine/xanthosine triphosphatase n=1 Tax=Chaetomidium leptoderma TaxID=669021 RepID=A0AAN7A148_9PEZI|nr:inosine triphosphate pyrophosphatase-like protein [Chaetomidium leptoderma]